MRNKGITPKANQLGAGRSGSVKGQKTKGNAKQVGQKVKKVKRNTVAGSPNARPSHTPSPKTSSTGPQGPKRNLGSGKIIGGTTGPKGAGSQSSAAKHSAKRTKARTTKNQETETTISIKGGLDLRTTEILHPLELAKVKRPDEPSEDFLRVLGSLIATGTPPDVAARVMGVDYNLFRRWIALGLENPDTVYGTFLRVIDIADAQDEATDIHAITVGVKHWAALAWKRGRKSPKRWGDKVTHTFEAIVEEAKPKQEEVANILTERAPHDAALILTMLESCGAYTMPQVPYDPALPTTQGAGPV